MKRDSKIVRRTKTIIAEPVPDMPKHPVEWLFRVAISILILYVGYLLARRSRMAIKDRIKKDVPHEKQLITNQLSEIVYYVVIGVGILFGFLAMGFQSTAILTFLSTGIVALGLALQGVITNILSGVHVALADNFRLGDDIIVYVPFIKEPVVGEVVGLNLTYVIMREKKTGSTIYMPNDSITTNVVENMSRRAIF